MKDVRLILSNLGLSEAESSVYLAMVSGARSAKEILKVTKLKRPTIYYVLSVLEKRGLVTKSNKEGEKKFILQPLKHLQVIADRKLSSAENLIDDTKYLIKALGVGESIDSQPRVSFFEGVEAVENVIMETLYCKDKHINNVFPDNNFFWQLGNREFVETYVEERSRKNITTRNLWEKSIEESSFDKKFFKQFPRTFSQSRILPKTMRNKFSTSIFLFDDKTLYVSSIKNCYAILIKSQEHHDTIQALFDGLWEISKPAFSN